MVTYWQLQEPLLITLDTTRQLKENKPLKKMQAWLFLHFKEVHNGRLTFSLAKECQRTLCHIMIACDSGMKV